MKKHLFVYLALMIAAPLFGQAAGEKKAAPAKNAGGGTAAAIQKLDKDRTEAIVKGDLDAVDKATGDDYVFTDDTGRVTMKKELMDNLKSGAIKLTSQTTSDVKIHVYGNTAVETGKVTAKGTRDGKDISGTERFTRVWVNRGGTWQTVAFQETKAQ